LYPVHQWSAECWPLLGEQVYGLGDQIGAGGVVAAQFEELCLDLGVKTDFPHPCSISTTYIDLLVDELIVWGGSG